MKNFSKFLSLNERDIIKGFLVAILGASLTAIYNLLQAGEVLGNEQRKAVVIAGVCAGLGYLIKNVFTNSDGNLGSESSQI